MITIDITEETKRYSDMADLLRHIADLIERGYTSGYHPSWDLSGEQETEN